MKKAICFIAAIAMCMAFTGCTDTSECAMPVTGKYCNMLVVEATGNTRILQDTDTGVLYLWYKDNKQYGQTLTPLYNADGTLKNINDYK